MTATRESVLRTQLVNQQQRAILARRGAAHTPTLATWAEKYERMADATARELSALTGGPEAAARHNLEALAAAGPAQTP